MPDEVLEGMLIAGADGKTYFIPQEDLDAFALPDDLASQAQDAIGEVSEVTGFNFEPNAQGLNFQPALHGRIGKLGPENIGPSAVATLTITGFFNSGYS
jgi:hypothetical protein